MAAIDTKHALTLQSIAGANFWVKLKTTIEKSGAHLCIQFTVKAGSGIRAVKKAHFIILNVSDVANLSDRIAGEYKLQNSQLTLNAPVHESVIKGLLSRAKKGDRTFVHLGHSLLLGHIDNMTSVFPDMFGLTREQADNLRASTDLETDDDLFDIQAIPFEDITNKINLFDDSGDLLLYRLSNEALSGPIQMGVLIGKVQNPRPVCRYPTSLKNMSEIRSKVMDRLSRIAIGEYIRVSFQGGALPDVFIGDISALSALEPPAACAVPPLEGSSPELDVTTATLPLDKAAPILPLDIPATELPPEDPAPTPIKTVAPLTFSFNHLECPSFGWSNIKNSSSKLYNEIRNGSGYALITFHGEIVGLAVSTTLAVTKGETPAPKQRLRITDIDEASLNILKAKSVLEVIKKDATILTIYPPSAIPELLATHIDAEHKQLAAISQILFEPAHFEITSLEAFDIVTDGRQTTPSTQPSVAMIDFLADVREHLRNPKTYSIVNWGGTPLEVSSNPTLMEDLPNLTDYFGLQIREVSKYSLPHTTPTHLLMAAFNQSARSEGVVFLLHEDGEPNPVLITSAQEFHISCMDYNPL